MSELENKKNENKRWLWIIGIITIIGVIGLTIYLVSQSNNEQKSPNPSNIQYLPSSEEAQTKIDEIKTSKGIDDQQAIIEFLANYVPEIKWWEINSLAELDEKINLVNKKTGFPPFKKVPEVSEFNQEIEKVFAYKIQLFIASVIPRESNGNIDWKGLNFQDYAQTVLKPILENVKFKPNFATQNNYQELGIRLKQEINSSLSSICSQFANLSDVNGLNKLTDNYLNKIFQGYIYAECIHDELAKQLNITNHQKYENQETGNSIENLSWNIALNEFNFKQN